MSRRIYLVLIAMVMFTIGVAVIWKAKDLSEHLLGAATVLGAFAVILTNVTNGNGHDK